MKQLEVYNLEFQWPGESMTIGQYKFVPVEDYRERFLALQHLVSVSGGRNGRIEACTGSHQITGTVHCPDAEDPPALGWGHAATTELDDILLLLSLCTRRKVFVLNPEEEEEPVVIADPRMFNYGGGLRLSLGQVKRVDESGHEEYSINLEGGLTEVNQLIRSDTWRATYGAGSFLFLFAAACHRQILETSFLTFWTIWEHLFRLHHEHWISRGSLKRLDAREKIAFVLTKYGLREKIDDADRSSVKRLTRIRNALTHDGSFEQEEDFEAADLFIRLTEFVIARILGLEPSKVFSPLERLDRFGRGELL